MNTENKPKNKQLLIILNRLEPFALYLVLFLPLLLTSRPVSNSFSAINEGDFYLKRILYSIPLIILILSLMLKTGKHTPQFYGLNRPNLKKTSLILLLAPLLIVLSLVISTIISHLDPQAIISRPQFTNYKIIPLLIIAFTAAAYMEELLFRAYLYQNLAKWNSPRVAMIISSFLFCLPHIDQGSGALIGTFILGLCFSMIYLKTKNLHIAAITHLFYNLSAIFLSSF